MQELKNLKVEVNELRNSLSSADLSVFGLLGLENIMELLAYKDLRSVNKWCEKNDVCVIKQGNRQFVNQWEFIVSLNKPFIIHLKRNHENWRELFVNYMKGNLFGLLPCSDEQREMAKSYKPNTKIEQSFLDKMKDL